MPLTLFYSVLAGRCLTQKPPGRPETPALFLESLPRGKAIWPSMSLCDSGTDICSGDAKKQGLTKRGPVHSQSATRVVQLSGASFLSSARTNARSPRLKLDFSYPVRAALQHCAASLARAFHERSQWARRRPKAVALAKKLHRASPKTGKRMSLRRVSAKLAEAGHLNERGKAFNPRSIKAMVER